MRLTRNRLVCCALLVTAFWTATFLRAGAQAGDSFEIAIGNGPHAGTYKLPADNMICLHVKAQKRFSAAYKDVSANDPKKISGAGINVFNSDDPGPKQGEVNIRFGDPEDKRPAPYGVFIPRESQGPLMLTRSGKAATVTFQGQTTDGVKVQVTAKCSEVNEF